MARAVLSVLVFAALAACGNEGGRLSIEEGVKCASEAHKGHPGTFSQRGTRFRICCVNDEYHTQWFGLNYRDLAR